MAKRDKNYFDNLKKILKENLLCAVFPNTGNDYAISYAKTLEVPLQKLCFKK